MKLVTLLDISSGGIIYRRKNEQIEVCLIATMGNKRWQLAKGNVEKKEPPEEAAIREVQEETGCRGVSEGLLDKVEYWYYHKGETGKVRHHKIVYLYLLQYVEGDVSKHDWEVDTAEWFSIGEALEKLSFDNEKIVLRKALEKLSHQEAGEK